MTTFILTGKKNICNFLGRSWDTVERWIREREFPARKIDGVWESDSALITEWRRNQINGQYLAEVSPETVIAQPRKKPVKSKR
ncbi:MAG: hypothetical protein PHX53_16635 [Syntrophales bacterium]|nr:hypothetical protein [Syntrophales bacterium]